jgi:hypothetical protein
MYQHLKKAQKSKQQAVANSTFKSTVFQLADNRVNVLSQKKLFNTSINNNVAQRNVIQFGKGTYGNSGKLARERFKKGGGSKVKKIDFKVWKRGREAQHLIPAQVCKYYGISKALANSSVNGMMLPSGRTTTNHLRMMSLDKGKMHHIDGGGSHPQYNKFAFKLAKQRGWKVGNVTSAHFISLADHLRVLNRPKRTGAAKGYINNLK